MRAFLLLMSLSLPLTIAAAQDRTPPGFSNGRFHVITLPRSPADAMGDKLMILDSATGDLWQWWDQPATAAAPAKTGITYMGRVTPGTAPGDTVIVPKSGTPKK